MRQSRPLLSRAVNVIIFGCPGSGKGTISKKIVKDFNFKHVSTGDLLRHNVLSGTPIGVAAKSLMDKGELVGDQLVLDMLLAELEKEGHQGNLLLDGYPRTIGQATSLEKHVPISNVIALNIPHQTIIDRLSGRWIHAPSGRTYAYDYNPPKVEGKDDVTGEDLIQRDDDKPAAIAARLQAYEHLTSPLKKHYESKGILHTFRGTMSDVIYPEVKKFLELTVK